MSSNNRNYGHTVRPVREAVEKPTVTASVENYTDQTSIIKTYVSSSAEITERGFYWGTNAEPSEADNKVVLENEVGYKANALINLTPNTTYYVKAYATNSEGTSYSEVVSFTTLETLVEYEYVDLGLPSGLKWATHNIGARQYATKKSKKREVKPLHLNNIHIHTYIYRSRRSYLRGYRRIYSSLSPAAL